MYVPPQVAQLDDREDLYRELTQAPGVKWATHRVENKRIDEINILEATKEAMTVRQAWAGTSCGRLGGVMDWYPCNSTPQPGPVTLRRGSSDVTGEGCSSSVGDLSTMIARRRTVPSR